MAQITAKNDVSILKISSFLGLNENPDGDTALKVGELSEMKNFRITQDGHLQIRPGTKTMLDLKEKMTESGQTVPETADLWGAWRGRVGEAYHILCAWGGRVWDVYPETGGARDLGSAYEAETSFFAFGGKVYLLNGHEFKSWDGGENTGFVTVDGYVPLIQVSTTPAGSGTLLESVNRLTDLRRVWFSPDGKATTFQLPERNLNAVTSVTVNGAAEPGYTENLTSGTVTFTTAPAAGTNTVEITYRKGPSGRATVLGMRFSELYNGSSDTRVFLYGDGTNRCIYSGIRYDTGQPSAEYFPDLYEVTVGESNIPVTALVRHYSRLMAYKLDSAWVIQYSSLGLADSSMTAAFYVQPVNRQFGNEAMGQVRLLENDPVTLDAGNAYKWVSGGYSTYISANENNAKRISDRVAQSMVEMDFKKIKTANMKQDHEYWFLQDGKALIYNYANDSWYRYEDLPFRLLVDAEGEQYGFARDGKVLRFDREYRNDDGENIVCRATTGSMDFDKDWLLKYSPMVFVALQPAGGARIYVTVETNRRSDYPKKLVSYGLATFLHMDFNHFSFGTNRKPQVKRVKMKVKKATYYKLIFESDSATATATVIETDVRLRYAGYVK